MLFTITLWMLFGYAVALVARRSFPGMQELAFFELAVFGALGALLGFTVGLAVCEGDFMEFRPAGIIGSFAGALAVLGLASLTERHEAR